MNKGKFLNQCYLCVKTNQVLPNMGYSFDFLYEDTFVKEHLIDYKTKDIWIKFEKIYALSNKLDKLEIGMYIRVYPVAPFYEIYYDYDIIFFNRTICGRKFDELNSNGHFLEDVFRLFSKERLYIENLLKNHDYQKLNSSELDTRIPLLDINSNNPAEYIIGCQPYLSRLLTYGIEYENKNKGRLEQDIDQVLCNISEQLIELVKCSTYHKEKIIVNNFPKYENSEAVIILDSLCKKYGGQRSSENDNAYVWNIGSCQLLEDDITFNVSVDIYLSAYINTVYMKVYTTMYVEIPFLDNFKITSYRMGCDHDLLMEKLAYMYYETIEKMEKIGYSIQEELNYKLPILDIDTNSMREIEIGEILFGLKPDEYSYTDKVEKI